VTIKMGGPQVNIMQLMAAGQADCIMGSSDMQMMQVRARAACPSPTWRPSSRRTRRC
jgi:hypothetical protein